MFNVSAPNVGPQGGLSEWISLAINAFLILGAIATLLSFLRGGFAYMVAGSDKKKAESARKIILNAIVGLIIIASAFVFWRLILQALNIDSIINIV